MGDIFDSETLLNAGVGGVIGAAGGATVALLRRKLQDQSKAKRQQFESPVATETLPIYEKTSAVGHVLGGLAGVYGGLTLTNKLLGRKRTKELDAQLADRENQLNQLLLSEQSQAAGKVGAPTLSIVRKAASVKSADWALEKIAGALYDNLMKSADMSFGELGKELEGELSGGGDQKLGNLYKLLAAGSGLGGLVAGYRVGAKTDPNRAMASRIKDTLKERLTGKDQLIGPMPIRVESDRPAMRPLRPGASSLVDPTKGRDVLEGI